VQVGSLLANATKPSRVILRRSTTAPFTEGLNKSDKGRSGHWKDSRISGPL